MRRRRRRWRPRSQLHAHRPHRVLLPSEERDATTGGACRLGARAAARALRHQPQPRARRARELLARVAAVGLRPQRWRGEHAATQRLQPPVHQRLQPCATEAATLCIRGCDAHLCMPLCAGRWASRPRTASASRQSRPRCTPRGSAARLRGSSRAGRRTDPARSASRSSNCAACATTPTLRRCCNPTSPGCNPTLPGCNPTRPGVRGDELLLGGADLVDGTAVLDVKPCAAASNTQGPHMGLQPLARRAAASDKPGCSLEHTWGARRQAARASGRHTCTRPHAHARMGCLERAACKNTQVRAIG